MAVEVAQDLMALGDWRVDLDYDPVLLDELVDVNGQPRKCHVLVYDSTGVLLYPPLVLLRCMADRDGITIGGRSIEWWLGLDDEGPLIIDREFVSGNDRLSDGTFEHGFLYWRAASTNWTEALNAAVHSTDPGEDDVLSSEAFETEAGQEYTATCDVSRSGSGVGRIHLRLAYTGHFTPTNLLGASGWGSSGDASYSAGVATLGPITQLQLVTNGGFETGDLTNWIVTGSGIAVGSSNPRSGTYALEVTAGGGGFDYIQSDSVDGAPVQAYTALPRERYLIEAFLAAASSPDGQVDAYVTVGYTDETPANIALFQQRLGAGTDSGPTSGEWSRLTADITIPDDAEWFILSLTRAGQSTGTWHLDDVTATRTSGNRSYVTGPQTFFNPERSYTWRAKVSGNGVTGGDVRLGMTLLGAGRPDLYTEGPPHDSTDADGWMEWTFTPPSGYESGSPVIVGTDILGAAFVLSDLTITDNDRSTLVVDDVSAASGSETLSRAFTTPTGAETVRVDIVAEADGAGWTVSNVALKRTSVTPSTHADVVSALLEDPDTGGALSVTPGTITGPSVIPYDWRVRHLTCRDALRHFAAVVASPAWEWRVNPDRTLDAGADIFSDHAPGSATPIILLDDDVDVEERPKVEANAEHLSTDVKVVGSERRRPGGAPILISGAAAVGSGFTDYNGVAANRTRLVSDSTVDHFGYASALAAELASREATPPVAVDVTMTGAVTERPRFDVGDWIYVHAPATGLSDPTNPVTIDGETVYPRRVRVLGLRRSHGPAHSIAIRREDGSTFTPDGVLWSPEDSTTLSVGDRLADFVIDPQGPAAGNQFRDYLRSRASA